MDRSFEQKILLYLDGLLDARSESEFLKEVARDPSKQRLLQQHRKLDAKLRDRSHPMAVPLRTQQALASSIPVLKEVVPNIAIPAATGKTGLVLGLSRRVISLIAIGTFLTGSVMILSLGSDDVDSIDRAKENQTQQQTPNDINASNENGQSVKDATQAASVSSNHSQAESISQIRGIDISDNSTVNPGVIPESDRVRLDAEKHAATSGIATVPESRAVTGTNTASVSGQENRAEFSYSLAPLNSLSGGVPRSIHERRFREFTSTFPTDLFTGRLRLYLETGAAQFGGTGSGASSGSGITGIYLAGLRFEISPTFAAGLELGQSRFTRERLDNHRAPLTNGGDGEIIVVDRSLQSEMASWLRVNMLYIFNPDSRLRFEADAGSGILLEADQALVFSTGISAMYALSTSLQVRAGLHYSGTWLSPAAPAPLIVEPGGGVIGIIRNADAAREMFSSAVEIRIGFGILLW